MLRKIKRFVRISILYVWTRLINLIYKKPRVVDDLKTLDEIINYNKSITRYGDGEILLMNMKNIKFQMADETLATRLREVLENERKGLLVGIPNIFTLKCMRWLTYDSKIFWQHQLIEQREIWYSIPKGRIYYDACITRPYIRYSNKQHSKQIFDGLKKIWNNREVVIVEGVYSRLGLGNDLFANTSSLQRILCPATNAFSVYDHILDTTSTVDKKKLILISLGPTATVLAYDLHERGYQAIDLGHIDLEYEWYLRGAMERVAIDNKMVNELDNQGVMDEKTDDIFESQVIAKVF
ncbi:MAG: SP_1767 family glycosyltransferase [Tyzzerella sp.]|nr:SP_1767 family glycosyltransferase [Tyzzerella sp.]